jgi:tetratricopeptide (TPR) repeat protein
MKENNTIEGLTAEEWFYKAYDLYEQIEYEEAIAAYSNAIQLDLNHVDVYNNRGLAKYTLGRKEAAINDYDIAIQLDPNYAIAYYNRGLAKYTLGRKEAAINDYDIAIQLDPNYAIAYINRGLAKSALGRKEAAIEDYDIAIQLAPHDANAYINRGLAKYALGRKEAAIEDYDIAIQLAPHDANAYINRGLAKYALGRKEAAIEDYDIAIQLAPHDANAYIGRGLAKSDLGRKESAIEDYDIAIQLDSHDAFAYNNRGIAKYALGRKESAIEDYDIAIQLDSHDADVYYNRGKTKYNLGWLQEAQYDYNRFISLANRTKFFQAKGLSIFSEYTTPFLSWHTLQKFTDFQNLQSVNTIVDETRQQCRPLWQFMDFLALKKAEQENPLQYYHTEALINFYMGDPIEAYKIYDEKIDSLDYGINLMGQYYFIESAKRFLEPHEGILNFALGQIERDTPELIKENALRELYYAGLILYNNNQIEQAHAYFVKADAYLPAAFMQVMTMKEVGMDTTLIEQKIKEVRKRDATEGGYLKGFPKQYLNLDAENYFPTFLRYAHYIELLEVLTEIRDTADPFEHNEMWDAFQWHNTDLEVLAGLIRKDELAAKSRALFAQFEANIKETYDTHKEKELAILEDRLGKGFIKQPNLIIFKELKDLADKGENMEHILGDLITVKMFDANTNALLIEYFYLNGNIDILGVYALYFYINRTITKNNPLHTSTQGILPEIGKKIVELIFSPSTPAGQVLTAAGSQAVINIFQSSATSEEDDIISKDPKISEYELFIENFLKFISYERETLGEVRFNQKYPLEGFDDWRKKKKNKD